MILKDKESKIKDFDRINFDEIKKSTYTVTEKLFDCFF